jgi:uncharacterized protein YlzI (FlbEa/FlbD family)
MGLVNGRKILCEQKHVVASKILSFFEKISSVSNSIKMVAKKLKVKAKDLQSYMLGVGLVFWGGCA